MNNSKQHFHEKVGFTVHGHANNYLGGKVRVIPFKRARKLRIKIKRMALIGARTRKYGRMTKLRVSFRPGNK